jgi:hypothetical protein
MKNFRIAWKCFLAEMEANNNTLKCSRDSPVGNSLCRFHFGADAHKVCFCYGNDSHMSDGDELLKSPS